MAKKWLTEEEWRTRDKIAKVLTKGKRWEVRRPTMSAVINELEIEEYECADRVLVKDLLFIGNRQGLPTHKIVAYVDDKRSKLVFASFYKVEYIYFPLHISEKCEIYLTGEEVDKVIEFLKEHEAHIDEDLYAVRTSPLIVLDKLD